MDNKEKLNEGIGSSFRQRGKKCQSMLMDLMNKFQKDPNGIESAEMFKSGFGSFLSRLKRFFGGKKENTEDLKIGIEPFIAGEIKDIEADHEKAKADFESMQADNKNDMHVKCSSILYNFVAKQTDLAAILKNSGINVDKMGNLTGNGKNVNAAAVYRKMLGNYDPNDAKTATKESLFSVTMDSFNDQVQRMDTLGQSIITNFEQTTKKGEVDEDIKNKLQAAVTTMSGAWKKKCADMKKGFPTVMSRILGSDEYKDYYKFIIETVMPKITEMTSDKVEEFIDTQDAESTPKGYRLTSNTISKENLKAAVKDDADAENLNTLIDNYNDEQVVIPEANVTNTWIFRINERMVANESLNEDGEGNQQNNTQTVVNNANKGKTVSTVIRQSSDDDRFVRANYVFKESVKDVADQVASITGITPVTPYETIDDKMVSKLFSHYQAAKSKSNNNTEGLALTSDAFKKSLEQIKNMEDKENVQKAINVVKGGGQQNQQTNQNQNQQNQQAQPQNGEQSAQVTDGGETPTSNDNNSLHVEYNVDKSMNESVNSVIFNIDLRYNRRNKDNSYVLMESVWGDGMCPYPETYLKENYEKIKKAKPSYSDVAKRVKNCGNLSFFKMCESCQHTVRMPYNRCGMLTDGNPLYESAFVIDFDAETGEFKSISGYGFTKITK